MLADIGVRKPTAGSLNPALFEHGFSLLRIIDFMEEQLLFWRDDPERPVVERETELSEQLCRFLNSAVQTYNWDFLRFSHEVPDETDARRTIDIAAHGSGVGAIVVEGRRYSMYETVLPIECKRLPTPRGARREYSEYVVTTAHGQTGGIQRFKLGLHGAANAMGVMIAYVQEGGSQRWIAAVNEWLAAIDDDLWRGEELELVSAGTIARLRSRHKRLPRGQIEIHHLWVSMA